MKEYITSIEFNSDLKQYRAHIKEADTGAIVFTTEYNFNTEQILKETREFFVKNSISSVPSTINSTIKTVNNSNYPEQPRKCCGK